MKRKVVTLEVAQDSGISALSPAQFAKARKAGATDYTYSQWSDGGLPALHDHKGNILFYEKGGRLVRPKQY